MGRYSAAAQRKKQKRTARHRTFQDGPKAIWDHPESRGGPGNLVPLECDRRNEKTKQIFMSSPSPSFSSRVPLRISPPTSVEALGITQRPPPLPDIKSTAKEGYFSLTTFPLLAGRRLLWRKERGRFHAANCPRFISKGLLVEFKWSRQGSYYRPVLLSYRFRFAITDISRNVIFSMGKKS